MIDTKKILSLLGVNIGTAYGKKDFVFIIKTGQILSSIGHSNISPAVATLSLFYDYDEKCSRTVKIAMGGAKFENVPLYPREKERGLGLSISSSDNKADTKIYYGVLKSFDDVCNDRLVFQVEANTYVVKLTDKRISESTNQRSMGLKAGALVAPGAGVGANAGIGSSKTKRLEHQVEHFGVLAKPNLSIQQDCNKRGSA